MKYSNYIPSFLKTYNQEWLVESPWLWETKSHYVAFYAGVLNVLVFASTCLYFLFGDEYQVHTLFPTSLGIVSFIGFGTWVYHLSRFNLEEGYGYKTDLIIKRRFLVYLACVLLFVFPAYLPNLMSLTVLGEFKDAFHGLLEVGVISFVTTMLLDIWKQVRNKQFLQTVVVNALTFTGIVLLMDISLFFVVLLTLVILFTLPILISSLGGLLETKEHQTWKVIGIASFQFLSPFLLMLAMCLVLIPLSLLGELFFVSMAGVSSYIYLIYFLPRFNKIHAHFHALPRSK
ncbi:MAG: hypothetical protein ACPGJS_13935 [Flammeovirgaceae bacterium]